MVRKSYYNKLFYYIVIFACLFFSAFAKFSSEQMLKISLYAVLPAAFILCLLKNNLSLKTNSYVHILWGLYALVAFSVLYAVYTNSALHELKKIIGPFLVSFLFGMTCKNQKTIPWLYFVYFVLYLSMWNYARLNIIGDITFGEDRLDDEKLNANEMAYYTFYLTFAIFILGEIFENNVLKLLFRVLFLLTIPLSVVVAIYTASRQVPIIQASIIIGLFYFRYMKDTKPYQKALFIIAVIAAIIVAVPMINSVYENSLLQFRNEETVTEDIRVELAIDAYNVGSQHFFTGVGAGNYSRFSFDGHFSHNTYLELFANCGIFGFLLFFYLMIRYIVVQFKRYRKSDDKMFLYFFWFGIVYALECNFYVMYPSIWLISFFILVASHSETYYSLSLNKTSPKKSDENILESNNKFIPS